MPASVQTPPILDYASLPPLNPNQLLHGSDALALATLIGNAPALLETLASSFYGWSFGPLFLEDVLATTIAAPLTIFAIFKLTVAAPPLQNHRLTRLLFLTYPILPALIAVTRFTTFALFDPWLSATNANYYHFQIAMMVADSLDMLWRIALCLPALLFMTHIAGRLHRPWLIPISTVVFLILAAAAVLNILGSAAVVAYDYPFLHGPPYPEGELREQIEALWGPLDPFTAPVICTPVCVQLLYWLLLAHLARRSARLRPIIIHK